MSLYLWLLRLNAVDSALERTGLRPLQLADHRVIVVVSHSHWAHQTYYHPIQRWVDMLGAPLFEGNAMTQKTCP